MKCYINNLAITTVLATSFLLEMSATEALIAECKENCDFDEDCAAGLLCADQHEKELIAAGYDVRKAYCGQVGKSYAEVCYDPKKIGVVDPLPVAPYKPKGKILGLCEADCDLDIDCADGLWCTDQHGGELKAAGIDPNFANCPMGDYPSTYEVCFDPKILKKSGGGGGDPHFRTYDGTKYSYHGECDLVMARSSEYDLDVHIRTEIVSGWSLISNAVLRIGNDRFELVNDGTTYHNGLKNVAYPMLLGAYEAKFKTIVDHGVTRILYEINLNDNDKITISLFKQMISVKVDAIFNDTEGMLGIQGTDGMVGRDRHTLIVEANKMGKEWQVRDTEAMLFQTIRAPQYPAECVLPSVSGRRLRHSEAELESAKNVCQSVSEDMFSFCVDDVLITGDSDIAHAYGMAF